jgi:hypothetical protein
MMYKLFENPKTKEVSCIIRLSDGANIPLSDDNTDYQAYLAWVEQGNEPLPAEAA